MNLIDLTYDMTDGMPTFPGDPVCEITTAQNYEHGYFISLLSMGSHTGTHVDSPAHKIPGAKSITDLGIMPFISEKCTVLDASGYDGEVDAAFIKANLNKLSGCDGVIIKTGWSKKHSEGDTFFIDFPGFSEDLAAELKKCGIKILGTESPSVHSARHLEVHDSILKENIVVVEDLTNVEKLPEYFEFYAVPLKLKDRDGSPVRAFAIER